MTCKTREISFISRTFVLPTLRVLGPLLFLTFTIGGPILWVGVFKSFHKPLFMADVVRSYGRYFLLFYTCPPILSGLYS